MESETNTLPASLMADTTKNTTIAMAMKKPSTINAIVCAGGGQTSQRAKPLRLLVALQVWHSRDRLRKAKWVAQLVILLLVVMPLEASKYRPLSSGFGAPKHAGG